MKDDEEEVGCLKYQGKWLKDVEVETKGLPIIFRHPLILLIFYKILERTLAQKELILFSLLEHLQ